MHYPISEPVRGSATDRYGYIDERGCVLIPPSFLGCAHFFEGKAAVLDDKGRTGFIDLNGRTSIPHHFQGLGRFHNGLCFISGGFIDHSGSWAIAPAFLAASAFSEGLASASKDGENFGFIDFSGDFLISAKFQPCKAFSEGLAAVCENDRWGFISRDGELEIPAVFESPTPKRFCNGVAAARLDSRWGFIDRKGAFIIGPEYDQVRPFSEGLACVKRNGKWGMISADGQVAVDFQFDDLEPLNGGLAAARIERAGFISPLGKWMIAPEFDQSLSFFGNLAAVKHGETYSYIHRGGTIEWSSEPGASIQYPPRPLFV
jgi:hypothetical protein